LQANVIIWAFKSFSSISQPAAKSPQNISWPLYQQGLAASGQIDLSGRDTNASVAIADSFHRYPFYRKSGANLGSALAIVHSSERKGVRSFTE
jgi:hypothetical protein